MQNHTLRRASSGGGGRKPRGRAGVVQNHTLRRASSGGGGRKPTGGAGVVQNHTLRRASSGGGGRKPRGGAGIVQNHTLRRASSGGGGRKPTGGAGVVQNHTLHRLSSKGVGRAAALPSGRKQDRDEPKFASIPTFPQPRLKPNLRLHLNPGEPILRKPLPRRREPFMAVEAASCRLMRIAGHAPQRQHMPPAAGNGTSSFNPEPAATE